MYYVLSKDMINSEIIPYLPQGKRGFPPKAPLVERVNSILYKLKSGVQWHLLPLESLFSGDAPHYKTVFGHYRKWCKADAWKKCWIELLTRHKSQLDLSSADLDGSHPLALKGGEAVGYQGRKKRKTTNALYLTDRQGLPLALSVSVASNHNDLYALDQSLDTIFETLTQAQIALDGLFLNADAGFDSQGFRESCQHRGILVNGATNKRNQKQRPEALLDELLYQQRFMIERTHAWMDSFRSLLNRFDTTLSSWMGFNYLAFMVS
ncbi:MAG: IS5 family transposase [Bacteroidia bacterium]|nr:IS5 family transposase [Bacteroidia bacterium]